MTERYLIKLYIVKMSTDSTCESATVINSFDLDFMFWESSNAGSLFPAFCYFGEKCNLQK